MNLQKLILTENACYKAGRKITVKGIMVHSTGANNPWLKRYVGPDDGKLGKSAQPLLIFRNGILKIFFLQRADRNNIDFDHLYLHHRRAITLIRHLHRYLPSRLAQDVQRGGGRQHIRIIVLADMP